MWTDVNNRSFFFFLFCLFVFHVSYRISSDLCFYYDSVNKVKPLEKIIKSKKNKLTDIKLLAYFYLFIYVFIHTIKLCSQMINHSFLFLKMKSNKTLILKLGNLIYISWFQSVLWSHPSTLFFNMFCIGPCCLLI